MIRVIAKSENNIKQQIKAIMQQMYKTNLCTDRMLACHIHKFIKAVCTYNDEFRYIDAYNDVLAMVGNEEISYISQSDCIEYTYKLDSELNLYYNCWSTNGEVDNDYCRFVDYQLTLDSKEDRKRIEEMDNSVISETDAYYDDMFEKVA